MICEEGIELIKEFEGIDQPSKWPGGSSGITLGYGCDIGADPKSLEAWKNELTTEQMARLRFACGLTGHAAETIAYKYQDIRITEEMALRVLTNYTLPREEDLTLKTFPGSEHLAPIVLAALVSLVYNRGSSMDGYRRKEMREIRDACASLHEAAKMSVVLARIFGALKEMKRLWYDEGLDGLLKRRDAEANLVLTALEKFVPACELPA